jgi:hypothetical protein
MIETKETKPNTTSNTEFLIAELLWLDKVINARAKEKYHAANDVNKDILISLPPPIIESTTAPYADFIHRENLSPEERFLLILVLATHIKPEIFDSYLSGATNRNGKLLAIAGGLVGEQYRGFIPTGLTFLYLLAPRETQYRLQLIEHLYNENKLVKNKIIRFGEQGLADPILSGAIVLDSEYLKKFIGIQSF